MKTKAQYLAKAKQCEKRASKGRRLEDKNWQLILARAYRMLAEAESKLAKQPLKRAA